MSGSDNKPKTVINTVPNKIEFCNFVPGDVVRVKSDSKGPNYVIEGMDWNCSMKVLMMPLSYIVNGLWSSLLIY